jgi:hypothetical protein
MAVLALFYPAPKDVVVDSACLYELYTSQWIIISQKGRALRPKYKPSGRALSDKIPSTAKKFDPSRVRNCSDGAWPVNLSKLCSTPT